MATKKLIGRFEGHVIEVVNKWLGGLTLYVDGKFQGKNNDLFAVNGNIPRITCNIELNGKMTEIKIYISAIFTTKIQIYVNGWQIAGDEF